MSKHRKNNTEELHPASDQECVLNNHDDVFKPFDNTFLIGCRMNA